MTAPRPSRPDPARRPDVLADLPDLLAERLDGTDVAHLPADLEGIGSTLPRHLTPRQAGSRPLPRSGADRPERPPKPTPRSRRTSATPERPSGRTFGPNARQYNRHR